MTRLVDVSPFGARFGLMRPFDIGRLLRLTLKMPHKLRVFDHVEDQYRVWSIVRNARLLEPKTPKDSLLEVGVAFIGKRPPKSYEEDPARRYEIAQTKLESQLWAAQEDSVEQLAEIITDEKRKESRQLIPVDVLIEVYEADKIVTTEQSVTENISRKGAAIFTALDLQPGTFVKMSNKRYTPACWESCDGNVQGLMASRAFTSNLSAVNGRCDCSLSRLDNGLPPRRCAGQVPPLDGGRERERQAKIYAT